MKAIEAIKIYKNGDTSVLKAEKWLKYLVMTAERNTNIERLNSIAELRHNVVLDYVERTLSILEDSHVPDDDFAIIQDVLKWSEVAKCGTSYHRQKWQKSGYNLYAHNEGSARIYGEVVGQPEPMVYSLIQTHGLIGQYLRGETSLASNEPLYDLIDMGQTEKEQLSQILHTLNKCIIGAVSMELWNNLEEKVVATIAKILDGNFDQDHTFGEKIELLRSMAISKGENTKQEITGLDTSLQKRLGELFNTNILWYVEPALSDFSFQHFIKVFALIHRSASWLVAEHISFENFMKHLYYDYNGQKRVNIYKKRIIENYLDSLSLEDIPAGKSLSNPHVQHTVTMSDDADRRSHTAFFDFEFSAAGSKLIEFCVEAEKAGLEYEKAPIMLFDIFGLRKDKYDRFNNEDHYLESMNSSVDYKKVILDYITGDVVVDIGPGGGVMLDLIEEHIPEVKPIGLDISTNVVESLNKKKFKEGKKWEVMQGDALDLKSYFPDTVPTTILFSSILHEIFSYQEYEGRQFNHDVVRKALVSAFEILPIGGRIVIRDGIMSDPADQIRKIKFHAEDGLEYLKRYALDFKGRDIEYKIVGHNEVLMPINDAMEFLYTYTWGPESYAHEVQEQFGYFTLSEYAECIATTLGEDADILVCKGYLQDGYTEALMPKISFYNEEGREVPLPNSTCLIVIEKTN